MRTLRIIISGRVQGVGFRYFLRQKAQFLGIKGYAENRPDNSLEVLAQSYNNNKLNNFLKDCRRGPVMAVVKGIDVSEEKNEKEYSFFNVK